MKLALNMFALFCFHVYLLLTSVTENIDIYSVLQYIEKSTQGFPAGQRVLKANVNVRSSKSKRLKLRSRARLRLLSARRASLSLLAQNFEINKQGQFCERSPCSSFISSRIETTPWIALVIILI